MYLPRGILDTYPSSLYILLFAYIVVFSDNSININVFMIGGFTMNAQSSRNKRSRSTPSKRMLICFSVWEVKRKSRKNEALNSNKCAEPDCIMRMWSGYSFLFWLQELETFYEYLDIPVDFLVILMYGKINLAEL